MLVRLDPRCPLHPKRQSPHRVSGEGWLHRRVRPISRMSKAAYFDPRLAPEAHFYRNRPNRIVCPAGNRNVAERDAQKDCILLRSNTSRRPVLPIQYDRSFHFALNFER